MTTDGYAAVVAVLGADARLVLALACPLCVMVWPWFVFGRGFVSALTLTA